MPIKHNTQLSQKDLQTRLEEWQAEATETSHPNYNHANLEDPLQQYIRISDLVHKLRKTPEAFTREDAIALFGALNSGQRMKNKLARENPLPDLVASLRELLDGPGTPAERIAQAAQRIRYAGPQMLGELFGWVHAETAPLYNNCAKDALKYLGYTFDAHDYDAFIAAHEQFKQVYQAQVGRLHPSLPLNLEIDKLYNVIDKVDLKAVTPEPERRYWRITLPDR